MADTAPIQRFMARMRQASTGNARDIRLTIAEATELCACIGQVLADVMNRGASPTGGARAPAGASQTVTFDGGSL